jgi:hypothetical protein
MGEISTQSIVGRVTAVMVKLFSFFSTAKLFSCVVRTEEGGRS